MGCVFTSSESEPEPAMKISLYDQLGADAINTVVDLFYVKVLENEKLSPFFAKIEMSILKNHQKRFLHHVLGGPNEYTGRTIFKAHAGARANGLKEEHFNLVAGCLVETLKELKLEKEHIDGIVETVLKVKNHVLGIKEVFLDRMDEL
eukprot:CAMPEP_0201569794 /NCGR_PEP_ID=MMETSP0190_2-20130828/11688_1 /ASSEMBLY_ACC=CAM_ASM_000263 /TAXON_ID=37353 /ORGANISM="Rosalina sp." /LENGTH=147 /DNA_ID=CAMNT_0047992545 /DNA_START=39 /DNA_END=482 /DNA_ORIENTATION=+